MQVYLDQCCGAEILLSANHDFFPINFFKSAGAGAGAAIHNIGSGSGRQLNFGSASGPATLI
jgi:hypothetical protein